jgi:hypothetical protein
MKAKFIFSLICVAAVTLTACEEYPYGYGYGGNRYYGGYGYPYSGYGYSGNRYYGGNGYYGGGYGYPYGSYGYGYLRWLWLLAAMGTMATPTAATAAIGITAVGTTAAIGITAVGTTAAIGPTANGTTAANVVIITTIGTKLT